MRILYDGPPSFANEVARELGAQGVRVAIDRSSSPGTEMRSAIQTMAYGAGGYVAMKVLDKVSDKVLDAAIQRATDKLRETFPDVRLWRDNERE